MILATREEFLAFLAIMSYNKQFQTEYNHLDFTATSLIANQNTEVAYEVFGRPTAEAIELHLRMYCNYSTINLVDNYRFVKTYEDKDNTKVVVLSAYTLLNEDYLRYDNNIIRQSEDLIINDPNLLPFFLEENGVIGIRLESGYYLMDESYIGALIK